MYSHQTLRLKNVSEKIVLEINKFSLNLVLMLIKMGLF